jgi:hypothetical protein
MQMQTKDVVLLPLMRDLLVQLDDRKAREYIAMAIRRVEIIGALVAPRVRQEPR